MSKPEVGERCYAFSRNIEVVKPLCCWYGWRYISVSGGEVRRE